MSKNDNEKAKEINYKKNYCKAFCINRKHINNNTVSRANCYHFHLSKSLCKLHFISSLLLKNISFYWLLSSVIFMLSPTEQITKLANGQTKPKKKRKMVWIGANVTLIFILHLWKEQSQWEPIFIEKTTL